MSILNSLIKAINAGSKWAYASWLPTLVG